MQRDDNLTIGLIKEAFLELGDKKNGFDFLRRFFFCDNFHLLVETGTSVDPIQLNSNFAHLSGSLYFPRWVVVAGDGCYRLPLVSSYDRK